MLLPNKISKLQEQKTCNFWINIVHINVTDIFLKNSKASSSSQNFTHFYNLWDIRIEWENVKTMYSDRTETVPEVYESDSERRTKKRNCREIIKKTWHFWQVLRWVRDWAQSHFLLSMNRPWICQFRKNLLLLNTKRGIE